MSNQLEAIFKALPNKTVTEDWKKSTMNPARIIELEPTLPAEYWEIEGAIYGAIVNKVNPDGLLILSIRDMSVGTKLNVRVFYANEYELDRITMVANIASRDFHVAEDWKGYGYQLQLFQISEQDRLKLRDLLNNHSKPEDIPGAPEWIADEPAFREAVLAPLPGHCRSYKDGKCVKTHAFCDLCQTADEIIISETKSSAKKARSHGSSPFMSVLSKLAGSFRP